MVRSGKIILVCGLSSLLLGVSFRAVAADSQEFPFQAIVDRNVFNVHPPPPPPPPDTTKLRAKITLTGILTIFGDKRAVMKVQFPAGAGQPAHEKSYILPEGQGQDGIDVLSVDENAGIVKVNNGGTPETLDIAKNGEKPLQGAPPGPGASPISLPMPANPAPVLPQASPVSSGSSRLPTRTLRLPPNNGGGLGISTSGGGLGVATGGLPASSTANQNASQMTAEQQMIMIEANRQLTAEQVLAGKLPPLPPTPLTPPGSPGSVAKSVPPPPPPP
jgi:hypothetical protein